MLRSVLRSLAAMAVGLTLLAGIWGLALALTWLAAGGDALSLDAEVRRLDLRGFDINHGRAFEHRCH